MFQETKPQMVSREELADYFGVSVRCVSNWQRGGVVPFLRIGKVVRFDMDEVKEALEKFKIKSID